MHGMKRITSEAESDDQPINLPVEDMQKILANKPSKSEIKIFFYLCSCDPSGMRQVEMPSKQQIAAALGISLKTVSKAQAKLEKLGIFEFTKQKVS